MKTLARPLALAALAALCGCGTAHNYLEPNEPRYVGGASLERASRGDGTIRVVSFNVAYAKKIDEAVVALNTPPLQGADVIALQEMDAPGSAAMARALGMNYVYYPASLHPKTGRDFGCAILSPWPITDSHKLVLPGRARLIKQARAAVAATVLVDGRPLTVYSVHLTSFFGMSGGGRRRQVQAIIADAKEIPHPVIAAGDFNSGSVAEHFTAAGFEWPTHGAGKTAGPFAYDHIVARGLRLAAPKSVGVAKAGPKASDHWPVWAVFAARSDQGPMAWRGRSR